MQNLFINQLTYLLLVSCINVYTCTSDSYVPEDWSFWTMKQFVALRINVYVYINIYIYIFPTYKEEQIYYILNVFSILR